MVYWSILNILGRIFRELEVPDVLLSGNHEKLGFGEKGFKKNLTVGRTLAKYQLTKEEEKLLRK